MPRKSRKKAQPTTLIHSSFAFKKKDVALLKYCAEETGLSQSELVRILIRACASGKRIPGIIAIDPHPSTEK